jgi:hypothetical protein
MQWLRLAALAAIPVLTVIAPTGAHADRQCNVPAGYYRLVDRESDGVIEFRQTPSHRAKLLAALDAGEVVQSDGTRSQDAASAATTWQQVTILQTTGWIPARKLWRALPLTLDKSLVPAAGNCGDSSPLWNMSWTGDRLRLSLFPERYDLPIQAVATSGNSGGALAGGSSAGVSYRFIYEDDVCRNAKGEIAGIGRAQLIFTRGDREHLYSGCCSAAAASFPPRSVPGQEQ